MAYDVNRVCACGVAPVGRVGVWRAAGGGCALALVLSAVAGCAGDEGSSAANAAAAPAPASTLLRPEDFARTPGDGAAEQTETALPIVITSEAAREGIGAVHIALGDPATTADGLPVIPGPAVRDAADGGSSLPLEQGRVSAVDLMVGQVNGQPIYAREFFSPLDARLRAEAERLPRDEWLALLGAEIDRIMFERVRDQLLLDEFDQSLTADQRVGVAAFLERLRTRIVSGNLGSALLADESLRREEGLTLDEKVERETDRQVILEQLRREVLRRVNVSFRDVERYYRQNLDRFQPVPTAKLRVVRVRLDDAASIARVEAASTPGAFAAAAAEVSSFRRSSEGRLDVVLESRSMSDTEFFGIAALNEATQRLVRAGDITPRVETERDAWWVMLEAIEQPEQRSLYEAQNEIEAEIRAERFRDAERAYFSELFGRSAVSDLDVMRGRLRSFALQRYLGEMPEG